MEGGALLAVIAVAAVVVAIAVRRADRPPPD